MGVRYHFLVPIHWPKPWTHPRGPSFALVPLQTAAPRLRSGRRRCRPRRPSPPPCSPTRRSPPPSTRRPSPPARSPTVAAAALADPVASAGARQATKPPSPPPHSSMHSPCPTPLHRAVHQPLPPQGRPWRISQCGSWSASGGGTGSSTNVVVVVIGGQLACPDLPLFN